MRAHCPRCRCPAELVALPEDQAIAVACWRCSILFPRGDDA